MVINPLFYGNRFAPLIVLAACIGLHIWGVSFIWGITGASVIADALFSWISLAAMVFFITHTFSYYHPSREKFWVSIGLPLLLSSVWWGICRLLAQWTISDNDYLYLFKNSEFYRLSIVFLILLATTIISMIWYQLSEKEDLQRRKEETEKMLKDAELFKLRQQLQPHFLFNSLNSINSLIGSRPELARQMVHQLSEFLRGTVKREDQKLIKLSEEIQYLRNYLDIEQVRFGHRLKISHDHQQNAMDSLLPPLLIQPLLENAIKHGLYATTGKIEIEFQAYLSDNYLYIEVTNPFEGESSDKSGAGFGLNSIRRRLYLLYGRSDLLSAERLQNHFRAQLKIPQQV